MYLRLSGCICVCCVGGNLVFKEALQSFVCFICKVATRRGSDNYPLSVRGPVPVPSDGQSIFKIHTQANTKKIARSPDIIKRFPSGKLISQFQTTVVSVRYATATVEDTDTDAMHWTARSNEVFFDSNTSSSSAALFLWLRMMMMRKMMQRI